MCWTTSEILGLDRRQLQKEADTVQGDVEAEVIMSNIDCFGLTALVTEGVQNTDCLEDVDSNYGVSNVTVGLVLPGGPGEVGECQCDVPWATIAEELEVERLADARVQFILEKSATSSLQGGLDLTKEKM